MSGSAKSIRDLAIKRARPRRIGANDMAGEVTEVLYYCAICKTIFEIVRNHIRPPSEPLCDVCQHPLPLAEGDDWLSYRLVRAHLRTQ